MPLENTNDWIDLIEHSLESSDPLFGKKIFVSGIHESAKLLLIDNDTGNNYAVVSVKSKNSAEGFG